MEHVYVCICIHTYNMVHPHTPVHTVHTYTYQMCMYVPIVEVRMHTYTHARIYVCMYTSEVYTLILYNNYICMVSHWNTYLQDETLLEKTV